jgi:muramoyltetrapeptide carboxypeptidase LdcA involved in peptidoglycan recycling
MRENDLMAENEQTVQHKLIKPKRLMPGDKVAAVTLSWGGPGSIPGRYEAGKRQLEEEFGITVVEMPNTLRSAEWIHANPKARAEDLMAAFADPSIKAVFSTIGGDDSVRILPYLDLSVIRNNPKIFMGYSDTTVTHLACYKAGLTSFYGPSFMSGFAENCGMFPYMVRSMRRALFSNAIIGEVEPNSDGWTVEHLDWKRPENQLRRRALNASQPWKLLQGNGTASGHLLGGCFDALEFLKGTDYWPSRDQWKGAILFIETSEEAPHPSRCGYWLRNYASQGILQDLSGILVGRPGGNVPESDFAKYEEALLKIVSKEYGLTDLPIMTRMDFGHTDPMCVIPYGLQAEIRCGESRLFINENAVE